MDSSRSEKITTLEALKLCVKALEEKLAIDIQVFDVSKTSTITNYCIIATGNSDPHLRALRNIVEATFDTYRIRPFEAEFDPKSGWLVVDGFDFMLHLLLPDQREEYNLETLWQGSTQLNLN